MAEKRIPSLDGLRAISILLVVLSHAKDSFGIPEWISKCLLTLCHADTGVTIFFVISGFIITTLLLVEKNSNNGKVDIKRFYIRRTLRIFPVNYLFICLLLFFNLAFGLKIQSALFLYAYTYTMNFAANGTWLLGHLWSLGVEEQFYLFWSWTTRLSLKMITGIASFIIVYASLARVLSYLHPEWAVRLLAPFFGYADSLMAGCLLAISRYTHPGLWKSPLLKSRLLRLISVFVVWLIGFLTLNGKAGFITLPLGRTIMSLCITYILASSISFRNCKTFKFLNHRLIIYIGVLSYSIYIWQQIFLCPKDFPGGQAWWRSFPINLLLTFCVAMISYHMWEKKFLKIKQRFKPAVSEA